VSSSDASALTRTGPVSSTSEAAGDGLEGLADATLPRPELAAKLRREQVFEGLFGRTDAAPVKIGRFTLLECIGSGGMGELYAA
jgi:hypothetical protein